jgi:parallel beta-helix repeat protein
MRRVLLLVLVLGAVSTFVPFAVQAAPKKGISVTCGDAITAPGTYVLAGDCNGAGIAIVDAHDVVLMLNNHTMTGPGALYQPYGDGINVGGLSNNVQIVGPGTVQGYWLGVDFGPYGIVTNSSVSHVQLVNNGYAGLELYGSNSGNVFEHNDVQNNAFYGISVYVVATGNVFAHNHVTGNGSGDISEDNPLGANDWEHNLFDVADKDYIH